MNDNRDVKIYVKAYDNTQFNHIIAQNYTINKLGRHILVVGQNKESNGFHQIYLYS